MKARLICGAIFSLVWLAISAAVLVQWHAQGCALKSLILAVSYYGAICGAIWLVVDEQLRKD